MEFGDKLKEIGKEFIFKGLPRIGAALIKTHPVGVALDEIGILRAVGDALGLGNDPAKIEKAVSEMTEEQLKSYTELKKLEADLEFKYIELEAKQLENAIILQEQLSKRHEIDTNSDSFITRHVRPITLRFLTVSYIIYLYISAFAGLSQEQMETAKSLGMQISGLLGVVFSFYFGSRGMEKIQEIKYNANHG